MLSDAQQADYRELAFRIAPELESRPLSILNANDLQGVPQPDACFGWAHDGAFEILALDNIPGYRGHGAVIALDLAAIEAAAEPGCVERCIKSVLVHEIAHAVPQPSHQLPRPKYSVFAEIQTLVLTQRLKEPSPPPGDEHDPHDWRFLRRALHLFARAEAAGHDIPLLHLVACAPWHSLEISYLPLIVGETVRMCDCSFAEIEATEPPSRFMAQWQQDLDNLQKWSMKST